MRECSLAATDVYSGLTLTKMTGCQAIANTSSLPTWTAVAAFSCAPLSGTAPLTVACTDASTNGPTAWSWTFGDGGTSTSQNPSHVYSISGTVYQSASNQTVIQGIPTFATLTVQ